MNLKRIKKLWDLTKKDPKALETLGKLTPEQIELIPDEGDGQGAYFGSGTEEEYKDFLREEDGTKPWYERIKNL